MATNANINDVKDRLLHGLSRGHELPNGEVRLREAEGAESTSVA